MKLQLIIILFFTVAFVVSCGSKPEKQAQKEHQSDQIQRGNEIAVEFVEKQADKKIDVLIGGKYFTSYRWPDNIFKPILYPIVTSAGTEITRGFPLNPRKGERNDHMHQIGNWLNYGNVNGFDFWGNGSKGLGVKSDNGGIIKHLGIERLSGGTGEGSMVTTGSWIDPSGKELLAERTEYHFIAEGPIRIIDRITTLSAAGEAVTFKDTKEGMFGFRVARQLELPSEQVVVQTSAQGNPTTEKEASREGATGNYRSSEGVTGKSVWGTRAKWMNLYGSIGEEKISLIISGHPDNISYPTYWHARGYGLFAANPLGVKDFTNEKEELNYTIPAGQSLSFKYRIIISSGEHLSDDNINAYAEKFAKRY